MATWTSTTCPGEPRRGRRGDHRARRGRALAAALLALLLAGCSSTTFLYNRLDFIVPWYVDDYVDLDRGQKRLLREQLEPFLQWHREVELPAYLGIIDAADTTLDSEVTAQQLAALGAQVESAWTRVEMRSLVWMIALGESLSQAQMDEFIDGLREEQADFEEEDLSRDDEEYRRDVLARVEDSLEDYLGRLQRGQVDELAAAVGQLRRADGVWLDERARWLERLQVLLQREPGWQDALREAIARREDFNSDRYREVYEHNAAVMYTALAQVLNSRSERQDSRLRGRLRDLREDLEVLIGQAPERAAAIRQRELASG